MKTKLFPKTRGYSRPNRSTAAGPTQGPGHVVGSPGSYEDGMLGERASPAAGGASMDARTGPKGATTANYGRGQGGFCYDASAKDCNPGGYEPAHSSGDR